MEQKFCQSCGMPLTEEVLGTNADGSKNEDYCMYCYKDGKFLQDCSMDEMPSKCGFSNSAAFNSAFKFAFGITPTDYVHSMSSMFKKKAVL